MSEAEKQAEVTFGQKLKEIRVRQGMSQISLAKLIGRGRVFIAKLETSPTANPTLSTVRMLAAALGCKPSDLIDNK